MAHTPAPRPSETRLRRQLLDTAQIMHREGLSPGRSGNVSARFGAGMLITPSGRAFDALAPGDMVHVPASGKIARGQLPPSSEWRLHRAVYDARPDALAIVHCHSLNATALACAETSIPAFHYMVALAGGADIPLVPYATFGTEELAQNAAAALARRDACLLAHHGQIALGDSLEAALELAREVETLAAQYLKARLLGAPAILDDAEMAKVLEKFASYGRKAPPKRRKG